ncbi:MAG TPA: hypothetical protein EYP48_02100 [Ignisphaera sp.]|nr:hypothetical protein [Ignisphaera sp.]
MPLKLHLVVYAPSSPQRLIDIARLAFSFDFVKSLVIVKPTGMAAQVGLADVSKLSYKTNRNLLILHSLSELPEVIKVDRMFVLVHDVEARDLKDIEIQGDIAIVIQGGDMPIPKQEIAVAEPITIAVSYGSAIPVADTAILLFIINERLKEESRRR